MCGFESPPDCWPNHTPLADQASALIKDNLGRVDDLIYHPLNSLVWPCSIIHTKPMRDIQGFCILAKDTVLELRTIATYHTVGDSERAALDDKINRCKVRRARAC